MRLFQNETHSQPGWMIAKVCVTVISGVVLNLGLCPIAVRALAIETPSLVRPLCSAWPTCLIWLNAWWIPSLVLDAVHLVLGRGTRPRQLADLVLGAFGTVTLAWMALDGGANAIPTEGAAATLALLSAFSVTVTATIVQLGLLLDGRQIIIQLTDA